MAAKYILAVLGVAFVMAGLARSAMGGSARAQARAWLLVGSIFAAVSAWLFYQG